MIDHTPFWYSFILGCVVILRAIAPLSILYTTFHIIYQPGFHILLFPLQIWAFLETAFYGIFYIYRHHHLQHPTVHPELPSREQRRELADHCLQTIPDYNAYLSKWFYGADVREIKRDNLKDFFCWAFLNSATDDPEYDEELEEYVVEFERKTGRKFEAGRNCSVKCYRLSIENAIILHRSLWWYFVSFSLCSIQVWEVVR